MSVVEVAIARTVGSAIIALLVALASVGCGGDEGAQKAASPKPAADIIRDTERKRIEALVMGDIEVARDLHADDFQVVPPDGNSLSKEEYLDLVGSGRLDYVVWEPISPIRVRVQGEKAVVRYRSKIGFAGNFGGTSEQSHVDTYERRDGRWQIVRSVTD